MEQKVYDVGASLEFSNIEVLALEECCLHLPSRRTRFPDGL